MEQIKFYLDEHIPNAVAQGLRRRGVDVLTVQEAGRSGFSDPEQLAFALSEQRMMITMDSDFLILASHRVTHAGIAYVTPTRSIGDLIGSVMLLYDVLTPDDVRTTSSSCEPQCYAQLLKQHPADDERVNFANDGYREVA